MIATDEDTAAGGAHTHPDHTAAVARVRGEVDDKYRALTEAVRGVSEHTAGLPDTISAAVHAAADRVKRDADVRHQQLIEAMREVRERAAAVPDGAAICAAVKDALEIPGQHAEARHLALIEGLRRLCENTEALPDSGAISAAVQLAMEPARCETDAWRRGLIEMLEQLRQETSSLPGAGAITAAVQAGVSEATEALSRLDLAEEARHRAIVAALGPIAEQAGMLPGTAATVEAIAAGVSRAASTLASVDTAVAGHIHAAAGLPQAVAEHGAMLEGIQSALGAQARWLQGANSHHQKLAEQVGQIADRGAKHDEWFGKVAAILDSQGRAVLAAASQAGEHAARVQEVLGDPEAHPGGIRARQDAHTQAIGELSRICDSHGQVLQQQTATLGAVSSTAGGIHKDVRGSLEMASRVSSAVSAVARMVEQVAKTQETHSAALRQIWSVLEPAKASRV